MIYGIVDGDLIANVIEAESLEIAQEVAGAGVEVVEGVRADAADTIVVPARPPSQPPWRSRCP